MTNGREIFLLERTGDSNLIAGMADYPQLITQEVDGPFFELFFGPK